MTFGLYTRLNDTGITMTRPNPDRSYIKLLMFIAKNPGINMKAFTQWNGRVSISWAYDYVNYFINEGYVNFKPRNGRNGRTIFISDNGLKKIAEAYANA